MRPRRTFYAPSFYVTYISLIADLGKKTRHSRYSCETEFWRMKRFYLIRVCAFRIYGSCYSSCMYSVSTRIYENTVKFQQFYYDRYWSRTWNFIESPVYTCITVRAIWRNEISIQSPKIASTKLRSYKWNVSVCYFGRIWYHFVALETIL